MKTTAKTLLRCLVLVLMALMLPASAKAAGEAELSASSKTLWIGSGGYTFSVNNICEDDYTIYYTVDNKSMASVDYKTGHVKGISTGEDAITRFYAILVHKKTGEVSILSTPLYVKEKASKVEISNKEIAEVALLPGDKVDFDAIMYNRAGQGTTTRGKYVTDYTLWYSSDSSIVSVNRSTGEVTAKKAGKATIYVRTYVNANGTGNYTAEDSVDVYVVGNIPTVTPKPSPTVRPTVTPTVKPTATPTVRPGVTARPTATPTPTPPVYDGTNLILSAKQSTRSSVTLEFAKDVSKELNKNNLYVADIVKYKKLYIKNISFSTDGRTAEVSFWNTLAAETTYSVIYGDFETLFSTSDGTISYIEVESKYVETMEATPVDIKIYDINGVDLTTTALLDSLIYECYNGFFDVNDRTILLYEAGDEATLTVTYSDLDYNSSTGSYPTYTGVGYFEALERIPVELKEVKVNIGRKVNYSSEQYKVAEGDDDVYVYARAVYNDSSVRKTELASGDLMFEASDATKLLIMDNGLLIPISTGNLDIIVRDKEYPDEVIAVYPVQVINARDVSKTKISASSVTLTSGLAADSSEIKVLLYDQYGKEMEAWTDIEIEPVVTSNNDIQVIGSEAVYLNTLTIDGSMFDPGIYRYKVYYEDFVHTLTVRAVTAKTASIHKITLSDTKLDTTCEEYEEVEKNLVIKLFSYDSNGYKVDIITSGSVYKNEFYYGYTLTKTGETESGTLEELPGDGIINIPVVWEDDVAGIKKLEKGTYTIKFYLSTNGVTKSSLLVQAKFTVTDSQTTPKIELHTSTINSSDIYEENIIELFNINGESILSAANLKYDLARIDYQEVGSTLWVKSITLHELFGGSYIEHEIVMNSMITIK